jgi:uncharacterized membrane protein
MLLFIFSIYIYYGYFCYSLPLSELLTKNRFQLLNQNLFTLQWLWNNTNLYDLFMIFIIYYALYFLYIFTIGIWTMLNSDSEDL